MKMPNKEQLENLRNTYKPRTVVELTSDMEDPYHPLPAGLQGEVRGVDDAGQIMVAWSNESSLSLIPGIDSFRIVKEAYKMVGLCKVSRSENCSGEDSDENYDGILMRIE